SGNIVLMEYFLDQGYVSESEECDGLNGILAACQSGNPEMLRFILDLGFLSISSNFIFKYPDFSIEFYLCAINNGNPNMVKLLYFLVIFLFKKQFKAMEILAEWRSYLEREILR